MMDAQTLFDSGISTCFMDKELVWQYKLVIMEKSTLVFVEVIDGQSRSSRQITHETKPLIVAIGSHTIMFVFNVILSLRNLVIIGFLSLFYIIHEWLAYEQSSFWNTIAWNLGVWNLC